MGAVTIDPIVQELTRQYARQLRHQERRAVLNSTGFSEVANWLPMAPVQSMIVPTSNEWRGYLVFRHPEDPGQCYFQFMGQSHRLNRIKRQLKNQCRQLNKSQARQPGLQQNQLAPFSAN